MWWDFVSHRAADGSIHTNAFQTVLQDRLWTDPQVTITNVRYTATSFHKEYILSFLDTVTGERVFFNVTVDVPPFNYSSAPGEIFTQQTHLGAVPPPPTAEPSPLPPWPPPITPPVGPPTEVVLEPPPLNPPPPPILPDQPPRKPPIGRLYPSGDYAVWNAFVQKWGDRVGRWALEVPISPGLELDLEEEWQRKMVQSVTQHKIDFIIELGRVFYMGEIKPRGSIAALGSALIQWQMANRMYKFDKLTRPAVICATISPILLPFAAQNGIVVFVTWGLDTEFGARIIEI